MLQVTDLTKKYPDFTLDNVSFEIPQGMIVGFIGQNGAGKTTTLKCIMRTVCPDGGKVVAFGKDMAEYESQNKQIISFTTGAFDYYPRESLAKIAKVYASFYDEWSQADFDNYCRRFNLVTSKKVCELSAGMKVKFALSLAMSHHAKLLILDEPTSGLDPAARDDLLGLFLELVERDGASVLFSTHITSDLEKCADHITYIQNGRIFASQTKKDFLAAYVLAEGTPEQLTPAMERALIGLRKHRESFAGLLEAKDAALAAGCRVTQPTLEDIMVHLEREAEQ